MAKLSRREREKMQRRNDIIDAAEKRFFQNGLDGVSMDEIARDLELSKPTLYLYFRNKESLFMAVVLRGMVILRDAFREAVDGEQSGREKILAISQAIVEYAQKHGDYYRLNIAARSDRFVPAYGRNEIEGEDTYGEYAAELFGHVMNSVKQGVEDGTLRANLDPMQTAMFISAALETVVQLPLYNQLLLKESGASLEDYRRQSIDVLLKGIAGEK